MDDSTLSLTYSYDKKGFQDEADITIQCSNGELDLIVRDGRYIGDNYDIIFRFDKGEAFRASSTENTKGDALFIQSPDKTKTIIREMMKGEKVVFKIFDYQKTAKVSELKLSGFTKAIKENSCFDQI